jgi:hypothetical protein
MARNPIDIKRAKQMEMLLTIEGGKALHTRQVSETGKNQQDSKLKEIIYQSLVGAGLRQG